MLLNRRQFVALSGVALVAAACSKAEDTTAATSAPEPAAGHPRLLLRESDLDRLRGWASDSNPLYSEGLVVLADKAMARMDDGTVPSEDTGSEAYETYPTEWYAELFAFMSLIDADVDARDDYGRRARELLMYVIDKASAGVGEEGEPFRMPRFATHDRSRWFGEAYGLTVDWAYPYFSAEDKQRIREVFMRWADEQFTAYPSQQDGGGAPNFTKDGPVNDPAMLEDRIALRWAMNNYFLGHMRNLGFMAMALDPADDPGDELGGFLRNATGQWLYMADEAMRTEAAGGWSPEGTEYAPTGLAYCAQFLTALHTAGQDDAAKWGPQVVLSDNPFYADYLPAMLHTLPPETVDAPPESPRPGSMFEAAMFGDLEIYAAPDLTDTLGALALYAGDRDDQSTVDGARWHMINVPSGGADGLLERVNDTDQFFTSILYFATMNPDGGDPPDPRPSLPLEHTAAGLNRTISRTSWADDARIFTYSLTWKTIDHQGGDGNEFELYRNGEWLTKQRSGYDTTWYTDYHNAVTVQNAPMPEGSDEMYGALADRGTQVAYQPAGDPTVVARSSGDDYFHATGDATNLYNSPSDGRTEVTHVSRSVLWLKPDHVIVYDRAETSTEGRFKRFWLQAAAPFEVAGGRAIVQTPGGQQLVSSTLLPDGALLVGSASEDDVGYIAVNEPMKHRLMVEAPGAPRQARFLNVVQGADGGAAPDEPVLLRSSAGTAYEGAAVGPTAAVFPVNLGDDVGTTTVPVPEGVTRVFVTGLAADTGYTVEWRGTELTVSSGGDAVADGGGVLISTT